MRSLSFYLLFFLSNSLWAQVFDQQNTPFAKLAVEIKASGLEQQRRVQEYAKLNKVPISYYDADGNWVVMVDVSQNGIPYYETVDNAGAAITTGVVKLRSGGGLGLNLEGEGMEVGVWDGGIVNNHIEFSDRILLKEGSAEDSHATHVTGTIVASGINENAKGMAPKAKVYAYDFSNDTPEMLAVARPDQSGIILSNHSYGLITGWRFNGGWQWFGDQSISALEDWRFGFYSNNARQWDQISFNAPYYLIVKSAGNDRSDVGSGSFPADCNGGSGYDCVGDKSTAKNILTIGAVNKVLTYNDPSSVVMSSFSAWGPTDDGRIKPDLVAAGVNLLSTFSSPSNNSYGTLNGTSMSTPNVTGSLILLQELHKKLNSGNYMRASTLKALAIHSAKEAGSNPGPDYRFGWGLVDVEAAAKLMLNKDDDNIIIREEILQNGESYELLLQPRPNTKVTATVVWNDPAGTPVAASLDPSNLMLVNDLDLRLVDDGGNEQFPWILNPSIVEQQALKGDNFRDNVEKLEFSQPEPRTYRLRLTHKGTLVNNSQAFSLIVEYTSVNDPRLTLFWIGNNGNWSDPGNWSLTSGGVPADTIPNDEINVVVDENSFSGADKTISLDYTFSCHSFTWLTKGRSGIALNGNTLAVRGNFTLATSEFSVANEGIIYFSNVQPCNNVLNLGPNDLSNASLHFNYSDCEWIITGSGKIGEINLKSGSVKLNDQELSLQKLISNSGNNRSLDISGSILNDVEIVDISSSSFALVSAQSNLTSSPLTVSSFDFGSTDYDGSLNIDGLGSVSTTGLVERLIVDGEISILNSMRVNSLEVKSGSSLEITESKELTCSSELVLSSSATNQITLRSNGSLPASIKMVGHYKKCYDHLIIAGINRTGSAVINAGLNSVIINATGWVKSLCEDVLFPDFEVNFPCVGGRTEFLDKSSGNILTWQWNFGDERPSAISSIQFANYTYVQSGTFDVTLTVANSIDSRSFTKSIDVQENPLAENEVMLSGNSLFSFRTAPTYTWYKDGALIPSSNSRTYIHGGTSGIYFVVTQDETCNRISESFLITSAEESENDGFQIYPNPSSDVVNLNVPSNQNDVTLVIMDTLGRVLHSRKLEDGINSIGVKDFPKGTLFFQLKNTKSVLTHRVVIN